jgi:hypothetical protein
VARVSPFVAILCVAGAACNALTGAGDFVIDDVPEKTPLSVDASGLDDPVTILDGGDVDAWGPTAVDDAGVDATADVDSGPPPVLDPWSAYTFTDVNKLGTCTGARYVAYNRRYNLWVGVRLCNSNRYKIYLSATKTGTYYEIADGAGGGEDHCEFVNPTFTLGANGDIDSGNCPTCSYSYAGTGTTGGNVKAYCRSDIGSAPILGDPWPGQCYTAHWYQCGVSIP